jgi:hypothetical protein
MDLSEIEKFETPAKVMKLSQAIRIGAEFVQEQRHLFLLDGCGCALGTAMYAMGMRHMHEGRENDKDWNYFPNKTAETFGISKGLAIQISSKHFRGEMNRLQIADWLESQGL